MTFFQSPSHCEYQRSADQRGRAQISLAARPESRRSPVSQRPRPVTAPPVRRNRSTLPLLLLLDLLSPLFLALPQPTYKFGNGPTARSTTLSAWAEMVSDGFAASAPGMVEPSTTKKPG
jgi:hypothetical protein